MNLPPEALQQLRAAQQSLVQIGDVWWLPEAAVPYPGGKDRYCLVVALEQAGGGIGATRAHYVAGSSRSSRGTTTVSAQAGVYGTGQDTYFRFWWSGSMDLLSLTEEGIWKGRLEAARFVEIEKAIRACKLVVLKRLLP